MWEAVAAEFIKLANGKYKRDWEAIKRKFEKMCFAKKPTGNAEPHPNITRAKAIKDKIAANEFIGHATKNDSDGENEDKNSPKAGIQILQVSETGRPLTKILPNE